MGLFQLIADFMRMILSGPRRIVDTIRYYRNQRLALKQIKAEVGAEGQDVGKVRSFFRKLGKVALILILIVLVVLLFWLLYFLNGYFDLPRLLGGPWPWLRPFWLPLLVILFLATLYLAYRLYRMLGPERELTDFSEIDQAWSEAVAALLQAEIDVREAPLFIVLGRPTAPLDAFFAASKIPWLVRQAPLRVDAPIQVYGHRSGIFVAVEKSSMVGAVADRLASNLVREEEVPGTRNSVFEDAPAPAPAAPQAPVEMSLEPADPLMSPNLLMKEATAGPKLATTYDLAQVLPTLDETNARESRSRWKPFAQEDLERLEGQAGYLARLIARYRRPFCPVNGIIILAPIQALANADESNQIAGAIETDLRIMRSALQTRCPAWLFVSDLEMVPGFDVLAATLDADRRGRLFGGELPLSPSVQPASAAALVEPAVDAFLGATATLLIKIFHTESPELATALAIKQNGRLYEFQQTLRSCREGLVGVLTRFAGQEMAEGFYLGGFYFGGTGVDPVTQQAFVPGVFRLVVDHQNQVSWTPDALAEEADYQRWTMFGYAAMGVFCIVLIALGVWRWQTVG
jgi:hypothetical protein